MIHNSPVAARRGTIARRTLAVSVLAGSLAISSFSSLSSSATPTASDTAGEVHLLGKGGWKPDKDLGSFYEVTKTIDAPKVWKRKGADGERITGDGVGVALIDSGVVPVPGLDAPGKIVNGPDLSFDAGDPALRHLDGYGHGTHLAGIIAGRDVDVKDGKEHDKKRFVGVAPDAHIVNVKVGASDGAVDVSQVIAAIDWVVEHRHAEGMNIRVLNLSFGTTSVQPYQVDPLAYAVERAWHSGIVVVAAAGNDGTGPLNNPAIDPFVIAVGASDHNGTKSHKDDVVADFSNPGTPERSPDLIAPGRSIVSLRAPGSFVDEQHETAQVTYDDQTRFFRGSGTSQAAAVVSGAVALLLDERPQLTPDQVKFVLQAAADPLPDGGAGQGAGVLDLEDVHKIAATDAPPQAFLRSDGSGSLELSRGGSHVMAGDGSPLLGELDIFGRAWNNGVSPTDIWTVGTAGADAGTTDWTGKTWRNEGWTGKTWRNDGWTGKTWRNEGWTGKTWRNGTWSGGSWS